MSKRRCKVRKTTNCEVKLRVVPPHFDKNFMLAFESNDQLLVTAYNYAVGKALADAEFHPFHQVGRDNEPGYHAWEVWVLPERVSRAVLEVLFPCIETHVNEYLASW